MLILEKMPEIHKKVSYFPEKIQEIHNTLQLIHVKDNYSFNTEAKMREVEYAVMKVMLKI